MMGTLSTPCFLSQRPTPRTATPNVLGSQIHEMTQQESVIRWVICNQHICGRTELKSQAHRAWAIRRTDNPPLEGCLPLRTDNPPLEVCLPHAPVLESYSLAGCGSRFPPSALERFPPDPFNFLIIFSIWWCCEQTQGHAGQLFYHRAICPPTLFLHPTPSL